MSRNQFALLSILLLGVSACSRPTPGPDKSLAGAVLGAGWGAGAGAVVGNQIDNTGPGIAIGAGFGAASGLMQGAGFDVIESEQREQEEKLAALRAQNMANARELQNVQARLDNALDNGAAGSGVYQVFFDSDATSLRSGAIANLEVIADSLRANPRASRVVVMGHSDDSGTPDYNQRLAEARARSVASYLSSRGLSLDQIVVESHGSTRPIASNSTEVGRQLNRRVDVYIAR